MKSDRLYAGTNSTPCDRNFFFNLRNYRFGFQKSPIFVDAAPYMTRYILYCGVFCVRLHKFFTGDEATPHDHPFWFVTFPFTSYYEYVGDIGVNQYIRRVRRFRFHFRKATFKHAVIARECGEDPFWTLVIAGRPTREWGFWPSATEFVPWRIWK